MSELLNLIKKYPHVDSYILAQYRDAQTSIVFNDDPDLDIITVDLPTAPEDWTEIEGFGLSPKEQYFKRQEYPRKLRELEEMQDEEGNLLNQDEIWAKIGEDYDYFKDEVEWIRLQWYRVINGYWFFNNGQITYIDGWHYFYLNFWELDEGMPEYRDRDRRFFIFARFCNNDPNCYGFIYPKHRREGATSKASCIHYQVISILERANGGIQSMTEDHAKTIFQKHIIDPWKTGLPFFFRPNHEGGDDPKNLLSFRPSASRGRKGSKKNAKKALLSAITYKSSNIKAYDTWKLYFYHADEIGKTEECDINSRWVVVKPCLALGGGNKIRGFSIHTSTVGEMEKGGGKNMQRLCKRSMYSERNKNGQTKSGLYILFMNAADGLEGFIDRYGMSIIDDPTPEQAEFTGKTYGAREYIQNTIDSEGEDESETFDLNEFIRQHPLSFRACFKGATTESGFNIRKIEERLDELRFKKNMVVSGNFEWEGEKFKSRIIWVPDPENGLFKVSYIPPVELQNNIFYDSREQTYFAQNLRMCAGADPFKYNKTKSNRKSDGGGAVFWGHDLRIDPPGKDVNEWETNRFICTYRNRVADKDEYADQMLRMTIFYGCPMFPEVDVPIVMEYFEKNGYGGLLVHQYDKGRFVERAGATAITYKQRIFGEYMTYIERHANRERHEDLLEECRDIDGIEDMTNYDLFTAGGYAMIGVNNYLPESSEIPNDKIEAGEFFEQYEYS